MSVFDYSDPQKHELLCVRSKTVIAELTQLSEVDTNRIADTRPTHLFLFDGMAIPGFEACVGNYRTTGGNPVLHCEVSFGTHNGARPNEVEQRIDELRTKIRTQFRLLKSHKFASEEAFLFHLAKYAARIIYDFIMIHPYCDGNGHISRYLLFAIVMPEGYTPYRWRIHPRPTSEYIEPMKASSPTDLGKLINLIIDDLVPID